MKTINIFIAIAAFSLVFLTACEQVVEIDLPKDNERLVVNGILNPDSNLQVFVSKSLFILDNSSLAGLIDAQVKVYDGSTLVETITDNVGGMYRSASFKPLVGKEYRIEVSAPNFETVDASATVPDYINILSIDTTRVQFQGYEQMILKIKFNDNAATSDYYAVEVGQTLFDYKYDENWNIIDSGYTFYATYITLYNNVAGDVYGTTLPFTDEFLTGETAEISVLADGYIFQKSDWVGDEVVVNLKKISKDYYNYISSYSKYQSVNGDPFAQPVKVFSNINKGFGIIGASTTSADTLKLQ